MRDDAEYQGTSAAEGMGASRCRDAEGVNCEGDHCITCSDEAVEMRVVEAREDGTAVCDGREVMTDLVGAVVPGERLLVHAGVAIARAS